MTLISFLAGCTKRTTFEKENINSDIINHYAQFSFEIFSKLNEEDSDKNVIISPLSISCALSMALQGAGTTTKDSMMKTLKYEEMQLEDINTTYMHILITWKKQIIKLNWISIILSDPEKEKV